MIFLVLRKKHQVLFFKHHFNLETEVSRNPGSLEFQGCSRVLPKRTTQENILSLHGLQVKSSAKNTKVGSSVLTLLFMNYRHSVKDLVCYFLECFSYLHLVSYMNVLLNFSVLYILKTLEFKALNRAVDLLYSGLRS